MTPPPDIVQPRDARFAALGAVLARAVVASEIDAAYALRVLRHQLRTMNVNSALKAPMRSEGAQQVIARYAAEDLPVPKNGSPDALHCDHVNALRADNLPHLQTTEAWLLALPLLKEVACVTAAENYALEKIERAGGDGWAKYETAGIKLERVGTET